MRALVFFMYQSQPKCQLAPEGLKRYLKSTSSHTTFHSLWPSTLVGPKPWLMNRGGDKQKERGEQSDEAVPI